MTNTITVVDACMGRGKTSAAIQYMNDHRDTKRFLYVTPYLNEVDRICECCDFEQPNDDEMTKSKDLWLHLKAGHNIASTHALLKLMSKKTIELIQNQHYTLIVDESINVIEKTFFSRCDAKVVIETLTTKAKDGRLIWRDGAYTGFMNECKRAADHGCLYECCGNLYKILNPDVLRAFDDVFILTYLFNGQYQKAYFDYFGFNYKIIGIEQRDGNCVFSNTPDLPPAINYKELIHIVDDPAAYCYGDDYYALSKGWYFKRGFGDKGMRKLRNGMKRFFLYSTNSEYPERLWTCFKSEKDKLVEKSTGRFRKNFLQIGAKATNDYRSCTAIAYMANMFLDPFYINAFRGEDRKVDINQDLFALSEMLQWIWRSAIRDGNPIDLYIPSRRMRELLIDWIEQTSKGGTQYEPKRTEVDIEPS